MYLKVFVADRELGERDRDRRLVIISIHVCIWFLCNVEPILIDFWFYLKPNCTRKAHVMSLVLYMCMTPFFKKKFQNNKNKKWCLGDYFYYWIIFKKLQKVTYKIFRLLYIYIYIWIMINFKFGAWDFFCDKDKLHNLRNRRVWKELWSPLFSFYLQLCH